VQFRRLQWRHGITFASKNVLEVLEDYCCSAKLPGIRGIGGGMHPPKLLLDSHSVCMYLMNFINIHHPVSPSRNIIRASNIREIIQKLY